jgi:hypothetical protein
MKSKDSGINSRPRAKRWPALGALTAKWQDWQGNATHVIVQQRLVIFPAVHPCVISVIGDKVFL